MLTHRERVIHHTEMQLKAANARTQRLVEAVEEVKTKYQPWERWGKRPTKWQQDAIHSALNKLFDTLAAEIDAEQGGGG